MDGRNYHFIFHRLNLINWIRMRESLGEKENGVKPLPPLFPKNGLSGPCSSWTKSRILQFESLRSFVSSSPVLTSSPYSRVRGPMELTWLWWITIYFMTRKDIVMSAFFGCPIMRICTNLTEPIWQWNDQTVSVHSFMSPHRFVPTSNFCMTVGNLQAYSGFSKEHC